jgi:hypothetical protein
MAIEAAAAPAVAVAVETPVTATVDPKAPEKTEKKPSVFWRALSTSFNVVREYTKEFAVVDLPYRMVLRLADKVSRAVKGKPFVEEESLLTFKEQARLKTMEDLRDKLKEHEGASALCKRIGDLVNESIPHVVGNLLRSAPQTAENAACNNAWLVIPFFKLYGIRYLNRQVLRHTDYRAAAVHTEAFGVFERYMASFRTKAAHTLLPKSLTNLWADAEHIALELLSNLQGIEKENSEKILRTPTNMLTTPKKVALLLREMARVCSVQTEVEKKLKETRIHETGNSNALFIARLDQHSTNGTLPEGLPDPKKVSLTPENLHEEMRKARVKHAHSIAGRLLQRYATSGMRFSILYHLEGKHLLTTVLGDILAEGVLEQLINPHLISTLILNSVGYKTIELETDKFGKGTEETIFSTGQKMIREALKEKPNSEEILRHFTNSKLKVAPGGVDAETQKVETRDKLKEYLVKIIKTAMGGGNAYNVSKSAAKSNFGLLGGANLLLNVAITSAAHAWKTLYGNHGKGLAAAVKQGIADEGTFVGEVADGIIGLIYSPAWSILSMQLFNALIEAVTTPDFEIAIPEDKSQAHFSDVSAFLCGRIVGKNTANVAATLFKSFTFTSFRQSIQPSQTTLLNKSVPLVTPTVQELLLYVRVTEYFRDLGVSPEGDAKFWECVVRRYIDIVESFNLTDDHAPQPFSIDQAQMRLRIRTKIVEKWVELSPKELLKELAKPTHEHLIPIGKVGKVIQPEVIIQSYEANK